MKKPAILRFVAVIVLIAAIAAAWHYAPHDSAELRLDVQWARHLGGWGPVLLAAIYVPAALLLVPGSWLTMAGAFVFGLWQAFLAVSVGSVAGACLAFLLSRYLFRGWVEQKLAGSPKFRALDRAVGEQGFRIVFLVRLSPLFPFGVLNYAFGATRISFGRYALATWIGMLPGTLMYCYLGSAAKELTDIVSGHGSSDPWHRALFFIGLAATVVVTLLVTRIARKALREAVREELA